MFIFHLLVKVSLSMGLTNTVHLWKGHYTSDLKLSFRCLTIRPFLLFTPSTSRRGSPWTRTSTPSRASWACRQGLKYFPIAPKHFRAGLEIRSVFSPFPHIALLSVFASQMGLQRFLWFLSSCLPPDKSNMLEHVTTGNVWERVHTVGRMNTSPRPGFKPTDSVSVLWAERSNH